MTRLRQTTPPLSSTWGPHQKQRDFSVRLLKKYTRRRTSEEFSFTSYLRELTRKKEGAKKHCTHSTHQSLKSLHNNLITENCLKCIRVVLSGINQERNTKNKSGDGLVKVFWGQVMLTFHGNSIRFFQHLCVCFMNDSDVVLLLLSLLLLSMTVRNISYLFRWPV